MYSDTQNQLNTLLNYSQTLDNIAETFIEALIWFLGNNRFNFDIQKSRNNIKIL